MTTISCTVSEKRAADACGQDRSTASDASSGGSDVTPHLIRRDFCRFDMTGRAGRGEWSPACRRAERHVERLWRFSAPGVGGGGATRHRRFYRALASQDRGPVGRSPEQTGRRREHRPAMVGCRRRSDVVVDGPNSAVGLAVADIVRVRNKVLIASGAGTALLTGAKCSPNTVLWTYDTRAMGHGLARGVLTQGGNS